MYLKIIYIHDNLATFQIYTTVMVEKYVYTIYATGNRYFPIKIKITAITFETLIFLTIKNVIY